MVRGGFAGGHFREVSGAAKAGAEVAGSHEVFAADKEGETLAHLEECLRNERGKEEKIRKYRVSTKGRVYLPVWVTSLAWFTRLALFRNRSPPSILEEIR